MAYEGVNAFYIIPRRTWTDESQSFSVNNKNGPDSDELCFHIYIDLAFFYFLYYSKIFL